MKALLCNNEIRDFGSVGAALTGHCFSEVHLNARDIDSLLYYGEEDPGKIIDYLLHLRTKFPPETTQ